jgi:two-component system nitrogen regulation response regulator GlnG
VLTPDCLPAGTRAGGRANDAARGVEKGSLDVTAMVRRLIQVGNRNIYRAVHNAVDRAIIEQVLEEVGGNQVACSELLGISRTTLRAKLQLLCDEQDQTGKDGPLA